ncbi:MAG: type I restriction-modification system subunit M N-terminal domain-containing protein [Candidatus Syntrophoarchaeum sp.]|nr:type I restriction-modification system subunit M N-terminal domain-containing protein [Candidatus Syntrophoarchaeum sp.]
MDASSYKDYVLTILFVKYVTDRYKDPTFRRHSTNLNIFSQINT